MNKQDNVVKACKDAMAAYSAELETKYRDMRFKIIKVRHLSDSTYAYLYITRAAVTNVDSSPCLPVHCFNGAFGFGGIPSIIRQYALFKKAVNKICNYKEEQVLHELVMMPEGTRWPLFLRWFPTGNKSVVYTIDRNYLLEYLKKIDTTLSVGDGNILVSEAFFDNNLEVSNG